MLVIKIYTGIRFTGNTKLLQWCCEAILPVIYHENLPFDTTTMIFEAVSGLNVDVFIEVNNYQQLSPTERNNQSLIAVQAIKKAHDLLEPPYNYPFLLSVDGQKANENMPLEPNIISAIDQFVSNIGYR